ncbi:coiled-coil domain-containing protein 158-like isoform X3 [Genypterus blacodes]|uniref:coiled-coil domain-containing protein 158-like isoform X3 n=1 Tax=Genypterus blacodes TaxID=154954 RepID=UPI003F75EAC0
MSSVFRPSAVYTNGISISNGDSRLHFENAESLYNTNVTLTGAGAAGTPDTCLLHLKFNTLTLDELSKELVKRTEETEKLREAVERATTMALKRVGYTYDSRNSSPVQSYHNPMWSSCQDVNIQPAEQEVRTQRDSRCPGNEVLDHAVDSSFSQASHLQKKLNQSCDQHLKDLEEAIMKLQMKLQDVQMERDVLSDLRLKDSKKHAYQMEKMLGMLEELQVTKRSGDQKLQETEDEAIALSRKVETLERTIKEGYGTLLSHEKQYGHNSRTSPDITTSPRQMCSRDLAANALEELKYETLQIHERHFLPVDHMGEEEYHGLTKQKERMEHLISSLGQEVATLTDKLSSWKSNNAALYVKLELLKKHAEKQTSFHQLQVSELKSAVSHHRDKACSLEQQLTKAQSEMEEAYRGRERSSQHTEALHSQLGQLKLEVCQAQESLANEKLQKKNLQDKAVVLSIRVEELHKELEERGLLVKQLRTLVGAVKEDCQVQMEALRCGEQQQCGLQTDIRALRGQLGSAREQLNRAEKENTCIQALLDQRALEGRKTQQVLEEREEQLQYRQQETQQGLTRLEEIQSRYQILHAEGETLRLKLDDKEKTIHILKLQMENSSQIAVQHGCTIDRLKKENNHLSNQMNQHKLEIQQLRAQLDEQKSGLAAMEQQRHQHQASAAEQRHRVHEETLEKQQLTTQLEVQRMQLLTLTKEHKELQRLHSCQSEEHQGVALKLQSQLKNTYAELEQARNNLEGVDGHGFQVATGMQKQITAKRAQIDSLKGRILQLEETVEKISQEKHYQDLENQRRVQELAFAREQKKQLTMELEALHVKGKQFRQRICELEEALQKMSGSFAGCNDFIQLQKQEFCRLKLQHALDMKELQGQNVRTAVTATPSAPVSSAPFATASSTLASDTSMKTHKQQHSPTRELRSLVKELKGVISENYRPHNGNSTTISSLHRRRSAPERVQRTTLSDAAKEVIGGSKLETKASSSEPQLLRTAETNGKKTVNNHFHEGHHVFSQLTAGKYASSLKPVSPGQKSPVHFLLTSDPNSHP